MSTAEFVAHRTCAKLHLNELRVALSIARGEGPVRRGAAHLGYGYTLDGEQFAFGQEMGRRIESAAGCALVETRLPAKAAQRALRFVDAPRALARLSAMAAAQGVGPQQLLDAPPPAQPKDSPACGGRLDTAGAG